MPHEGGLRRRDLRAVARARRGRRGHSDQRQRVSRHASSGDRRRTSARRRAPGRLCVSPARHGRGTATLRSRRRPRAQARRALRAVAPRRFSRNSRQARAVDEAGPHPARPSPHRLHRNGRLRRGAIPQWPCGARRPADRRRRSKKRRPQADRRRNARDLHGRWRVARDRARRETAKTLPRTGHVRVHGAGRPRGLLLPARRVDPELRRHHRDRRRARGILDPQDAVGKAEGGFRRLASRDPDHHRHRRSRPVFPLVAAQPPADP